MKKKYTWISDAWSMRRLSRRPSVYHIENCQISSSLLTVQAVLIICVYQVVIKQLLIQTHLRTQRAWSCCIVRVSLSSFKAHSRQFFTDFFAPYMVKKLTLSNFSFLEDMKYQRVGGSGISIQSRKQISSQDAYCYLEIPFLPYFDPNYSFTAKIDIFQVSPYCPYCQKAQNCKSMLDIWLTIPLLYFLCFPPSFSFCQVFHSKAM